GGRPPVTTLPTTPPVGPSHSEGGGRRGTRGTPGAQVVTQSPGRAVATGLGATAGVEVVAPPHATSRRGPKALGSRPRMTGFYVRSGRSQVRQQAGRDLVLLGPRQDHLPDH